MNNKYDVIIIGAGASGLMCASIASKRGRKVALIEHGSQLGKKILISGGGRCNFTNRFVSEKNYISSNEQFCRSALAKFQPEDLLALLEKHGIQYFEKDHGQLFCRSSSKLILAMLKKEAENCDFFLNTEIKSVSKNVIPAKRLCHNVGEGLCPLPIMQLNVFYGRHRGRPLRCDTVSKARIQNLSKILDPRFHGDDKTGLFFIRTNSGDFECESLVIATGGISYKELGASDLGYRIAHQFGLNVVPQMAGLVPLLFKFGELSGISMKVKVECGGKSFIDDMLFTHKGLSGPAILQISSYWKEKEEISIDLFPSFDIFSFLKEKKTDGNRSKLKNLLSQFVPSRFAEIWCEKYANDKPLSSFSEKELSDAAEKMHSWKIVPSGRGSYEEAEVTVGGVDVAELSSKTMEAEKVKGLYFIGEVVDVTGELGGYNLHWAFASGHAAGHFI